MPDQPPPDMELSALENNDNMELHVPNPAHVAARRQEQAAAAHRRRRYKFNDRGDGMFEQERKLGAHPHLVQTGRHAGRSNIRFLGSYDDQMHLLFNDFFTSIANERFWVLLLVMLAAYTVSYAFWGIVWYLLYILDQRCVNGLEDNFLSAYMFSLETQATIGFGERAVGICAPSAVALTLQNVCGMILDAFALGIIFAKLSHPKQRGRSIYMSECATIACRDGQLKFMFRIADVRRSTACDARVRACLYTWGPGRMTPEGEFLPVRVEPMELVNMDGMLLLPTVLEHPIDQRSPLHGLKRDDLKEMNAEVVVTFEATSDFGDTFMVRQSYLASEVHWGSVFVPITQRAPTGSTQHVVDMSRFHDVTPQRGLPQLPQGPLSQYMVAGCKGQPPSVPFPNLGDNTLAISELCVVSERQPGERVLMFRVGDTRPGHMLEVHVRAYLYEWEGVNYSTGEELPFTIKEIDLGYKDGADRLMLRFPQIVEVSLAEGSPLARWGHGQDRCPKWGAELVVVVEAVSFPTSSNMMRTMTYKLPEAIKYDHYFAHMQSKRETGLPVPGVDWTSFHITVPHGHAYIAPSSSSAQPTNST